MIDNLCNITC